METLAPDTLRDGQTAPLAEPLAEPAHRVTTEPLAIPARARPTLTYAVYTPDDTLRAKAAIDDVAPDEAQRGRRIALGAFAATVAILTTLAAVGSCDEAPPGRVETTSAALSASQVAVAPPAPSASSSVTELVPLPAAPPIAVVPPLPAGAPAITPRRRAPHRLLPKRQ